MPEIYHGFFEEFHGREVTPELQRELQARYEALPPEQQPEFIRSLIGPVGLNMMAARQAYDLIYVFREAGDEKRIAAEQGEPVPVVRGVDDDAINTLLSFVWRSSGDQMQVMSPEDLFANVFTMGMEVGVRFAQRASNEDPPGS